MTPDEFNRLKPGDKIKRSPPFGAWATVRFVRNGYVGIDISTTITESDMNEWMCMVSIKMDGE